MLGCFLAAGKALPFLSVAGIAMKPRTKIGIVAVTLVSLAPFCVANAQAPAVVGAATEIPGVVEGGSQIQRILEGYDGLDDPIGLMNGTLVFAEPGGRRIHRLNTDTNEVSVLVAESNESHGIGQDSEGRLISVQAWDGSQRVGVIYPLGSETMLANAYDGMRFSRPNDLVVASNGGVYFTDPGLTAGQTEELVERYGGTPLGPRLPPAVYYIAPGQAPVMIEDNMIRPNGIQLSRNETTLYVSDSNGDHVIAWDIQPDGLVENRREFGTLQGRSNRDNGLGGIKTFADGMAVDNDDRLYVATGGGIEVLNTQGEHLGIIAVRCLPRDCQNLAFGGPTRQTLYIAGAGSLYKVEMIAGGLTTRAK
jgi:gluconolactonase